jgi:hypothetical protein
MDNGEDREATVELDPRTRAVQEWSIAEQRVISARRERDRAVKHVEEVESVLADARAAAAEALGVRESDLCGLR